MFAFDFSIITWDLFVILFFLIVIFVYGMKAGRGKMFFGIISAYIAIVLTELFPFTPTIAGALNLKDIYLIKLVLFIVVLAITFLVFSKSSGSSYKSHWFQVFLLSLIFTGIVLGNLIAFILKDIPIEFSPLTISFLASIKARFWWLLASVIVLVFVRKKISSN